MRMSNAPRAEPYMSTCCLFIPIRVGCFILGYLNLIFNIIHTFALLSLTTLIGIQTHGFDHFDHTTESYGAPTFPTTDEFDEESVSTSFLNQLGVLLIIPLIGNVAWLFLNIACIVGVHKKRPNHLRIYVGFATGRLMLALAGFVYLMAKGDISLQTVLTHSFDLGLTAYFLMVYYIYAKQLEREQMESLRPSPVETKCNEIAIIYPMKLDKQNLVHY